MDTLGAADGISRVKDATDQVNSILDGYVDEIALSTGNSTNRIRECFAPKQWGQVWFSGHQSPSAFLRQVAKHRSFNSDDWMRRDRSNAFDALLAATHPQSFVVSAQEAAQAIKQGQVPHVSSECTKRSYNSLSHLERLLLDEGILEVYDRTFRDRVSAVRDFAFVVHGSDDQGVQTQEFNFWPRSTANNHIVRAALIAEGDADTEAESTERGG